MRSPLWAYMLALAIVLATSIVIYGAALLCNAIEVYFHVEDCLVGVAFGLFFLLLSYWRDRVIRFKYLVWMTGFAFGYVASRMHHEAAHNWFRRITAWYILFYWIDGPWRKKLWGRIRSAGLTAINAASFKRQSKEVFQ